MQCVALLIQIRILRYNNGELLTLSAPTNGEYANETRLLGFHSVDVEIGIVTDVSLENVAAFTDGLQRLVLRMPEQSPHQGFFNPLFNQVNEQSEDEAGYVLAELLASPQVNSRTDDDRTFVIAQAL